MKEAPAPAKKDEDLYEMAIQHKKDEDFSGWYTDVSCTYPSESGNVADGIGRDQGTNAGLLRYLGMLHSPTGLVQHLAIDSE